MSIKIDPGYRALVRAVKANPHKLELIKEYFYATHAGGRGPSGESAKQLAKLASANPRIYAYFLTQLSPLLPADGLRDNWVMSDLLLNKGKSNSRTWSALLAALPRIRNEEIKNYLMSVMAQLRSPDLPRAILTEVDKYLSPLLSKDKYTEEEMGDFVHYCIGAEWSMSLLKKAAGLIIAETDRNCYLASRNIIRHMVSKTPKEMLAGLADELELLTGKLYQLDEDPDYQIMAAFVVRVYESHVNEPEQALALLSKVCKPAWGEKASIWLPIQMENICRKKGLSFNQLITWFPPINGYSKVASFRIPAADELPAVAPEQAIVFSGPSQRILDHDKSTAASLLRKFSSVAKFPVTVYLGPGEDNRIPITEVRVETLETPLAFYSEAPGNCNKQFYEFRLGNAKGRSSLNLGEVVEYLQDENKAHKDDGEKVGLDGLITQGRIYHGRDHYKLPRDFPFAQFREKGEKWKTFVRGRLGNNVPDSIAQLFLRREGNTFIWESKDLNDRFNALVYMKGVGYNILLLDYIPDLKLGSDRSDKN